MGTAQTSVQSPKEITIGSVAAFYSTDSGSSYVNVGLGDSFAYAEEITALDSAPDNGETPVNLKGIGGQNVTITGNLWEYNLLKIDAIRGGIDTYSTVASALVEGNEQTVASGSWHYNVPIVLEGQNQAGTIPTINSVTLGTNGAIVLLTDYVTLKMPGGEWAIAILDSATVTTEAQSVVIDTDYTPSASSSLSTGGLTDITPIWWRFINRVAAIADATDAAANAGVALNAAIYRKTVYDFYSCTVNAGSGQTFIGKDETAPQVVYALSLLARNDAARTAGDQLYVVTKSIELQSAVTI